MKKLLILLFSILISFNSYGEWRKIATNVNGDIYYIDINTIKEHGGYVYWWRISDYLSPTEYGDMSVKRYRQTDCGVMRSKTLTMIFYKQPMGNGEGDVYNPPDEWVYVVPDSVGEILTKWVCDYVK